jgi:WS/DGAT/MGAT family acyltransferase
MVAASSNLARGRVAPADGLWLQDSQTNRMIISGFFAVDSLSIETLRSLFEERVVRQGGGDRFPRFRWRVVWHGSTPHWQLDPDYSIDRHIVEVGDPALSTQEGLENHLALMAAEEMPTDRSPWQLQLVPRLEDGRSAVIFRLHHCLGDGIGLVPILFSMMDPAPAGESPDAEEWSAEDLSAEDLAGEDSSSLDSSAEDSSAAATAIPEAAADPAQRHANATAKGKRTGGAGFLTRAVMQGPFMVLGKLLQRRDRSALHGPLLSGDKRVAWSVPLDLDHIKRLKTAAGATVNDILTSCVAGALRHHLQASHGEEVASIRATVPVDVRSPRKPLKMENRFASVLLELPSGIAGARSRLAKVRERMRLVKRSVEPIVMFGTVRLLLTVLPQGASRRLADFLANKCTCVLTNVPGPQEPIYLAGRRVHDMIFWVPQRSEIGIGISIISFNGSVRVGVLSDREVLPRPQELIEHFHREMAALEGAFLSDD